MAMAASDLFVYSGPLADVCVLSVLGARKRWRVFPAFCGLILFDLLSSILILGGQLWTSWKVYAFLDVVSILLQFAVVFELLTKVLPRASRLGAKGRRFFTYSSLVGLLIAGMAAAFLNPPDIYGPTLYETRADLFASLVVCETVIAIMLAAQSVGMGWRNHLIAIAQGLMLWALFVVVIEGFGPYFNFHHAVYNKLYYVRSLVYLGTLAYWSVSLWREEPARRPISPEMRKYIVALHDQVQYDLEKAAH